MCGAAVAVGGMGVIWAHSASIIINPIPMGPPGESARCQKPTGFSAAYSKGVLRSDGGGVSYDGFR